MGCKSSVFRHIYAASSGIGRADTHRTIYHPVVQADRTAGFQSADPGADPGGVANFIHAQVAQ